MVTHVRPPTFAVDDTDKAALAKKSGQRVVFTPENDRIIIMCRIVLGLMKKDTNRSTYPFVEIRDILHEYCTDSFDKTAPNCRTRLFTLMKNPKNVLTVKVCVAEYSSRQEFVGVADRKLPFRQTFISTVKRIIQLSRTQASSLEDTSQLSSSQNYILEASFTEDDPCLYN
ncbi:hypothetical protein QZH41_017683 [Actinostola sp. cb2023]|nr:hypothetical protein QZH41_017683 [Actinostola sp. cb2023]